MKNFIRNILILAGIVFVVFCVWYFREIVIYILVAGVLSIMGRPLVDLFDRIKIRKISIPKAVSALLALLIIWGLIFLFFYIFVPLVASQIQQLSSIDSEQLVKIIEEPIRKTENLLRALNPDLEEISVRAYIASKITDILSIEFVQDMIGSAARTMDNIVIAFFSISFITFFFLKDQHLFFESIVMWVPDKYVDNVTRALYSIKALLTRYFVGIVIQSTCIMIMMTTGMTVVGIDFHQALVMGLIAGILNVIPYVGPWLGFFITVTMGIASHLGYDFQSVIVPLVWKMALVVAITQATDNVVFQPVIFSSSVRAHPLEIFVVVLAAGFAAGIPGMILGIPAYTVLRVFAREFFYNLKAVQKITSSLPDTEEIMEKIKEEEEKEHGKNL
ncbi:MAG TPA: AI-2E family transporter [Bacteroidales bacterium]|nr:AI-2E family transporter [Bacteroidales bacterium]HOK73665.1 AI-2E family transporter [Bacteroidales bacterium]HOM39339.1 AI-2E family transporter [Bacteroidales bacterium]HOU30030.1 AI-2E family transporter [Bacteroidales bacterium]HQG56469.1 AI-2E family transporter [Bacteroidales bacterium]